MTTKKFQSATTNDMGDRELQDLLQEWDRMAPVGREFGSPDYERLEELDHLAVLAKGSPHAARRWLDAPNPALDGLTPEEAAKTADGLARVHQLLLSHSDTQ